MTKFIEITAEVWRGLDGTIGSERICYINVDLIKYYHTERKDKTKVVFGEGTDNFIVVICDLKKFSKLVEKASGSINP